MNKVLEIHVEGPDSVIQLGVIRKALNEKLRDTGLFCPLISELVSLIAASTRDNVLNLEAVPRPGEIIRTGRQAKRSSVGQYLA